MLGIAKHEIRESDSQRSIEIKIHHTFKMTFKVIVSSTWFSILILLIYLSMLLILSAHAVYRERPHPIHHLLLDPSILQRLEPDQ